MKVIIGNYVKEFKDKYCNEKIVDFNIFFTKADFCIFEKCKIYLENRLYTEEEFFLIKAQVMTYLEVMEFSPKIKNRIHDIFIKIIQTYNFR